MVGLHRARENAVSAARLDPAAVRRTLRAAGMRPQRRFSQNFLVDVDVLEAILDAAGASPGRTVLEIGPGLGILTGGLLEAGAAVTAVELDRGMVEHLATAFEPAIAAAAEGPRPPAPNPPGSLRLVAADILDADLPGLLILPFDVVANLPYHVTSPVLHRLLGAEPRPERCILMVQREVAERVAAKPGAMSYLSVFVQYHAVASLVRVVPRDAFEPAPAVESAIISLDVRPADGPGRLPPEMEDHLWRLVQAGFRERRKMLRNVLGRQLPVGQGRVDAALAATGIAGDRRPQTLAVTDWISLLGALGPVPPDHRGQGRRASRVEADAADLAGPGEADAGPGHDAGPP
jgi:16S rRNA (adenine1518-N6/adenine1519-N6)-dimethyltransferase